LRQEISTLEAERATKYRQFSLLSRVARWHSSGNTRAPPPTKLPLLTLLIDARSARGNNTISNNGARGARASAKEGGRIKPSNDDDGNDNNAAFDVCVCMHT